jgi:hypothetical protein
LPTDAVGFEGETEMLSNFGLETVRVAFPRTEPKLAVIVVVPFAIACANPVALIVAAFVADEDQTTPVVMTEVEPSEYLPVA